MRSATDRIAPNNGGTVCGQVWYAGMTQLMIVAAPAAISLNAVASPASSAIRVTCGCSGPPPVRLTILTSSPASASSRAAA
ncbi:hypothetical protein [Lentzea indica]|uniref:hypothetical protein n=1 Tax=Lentzea indica TaxID=2604800 RepID=UPI001FE838CB|nr:hypothetical protein [Lentzea indica]